jgi:hypothetical protein
MEEPRKYGQGRQAGGLRSVGTTPSSQTKGVQSEIRTLSLLLDQNVGTVTCRGSSRLATRKGPLAEPSHEGSASWLLRELRLQPIGVFQLALQTELVYWGEWESRLEISVAWISPVFSAVPLQIT